MDMEFSPWWQDIISTAPKHLAVAGKGFQISILKFQISNPKSQKNSGKRKGVND
ncbi:MAG: hypothetical protein M0Z50_04355 [Planctomycetia bacterium]|nr:hypothetical protein [Planctomycetia bacterium]